MKEIIPLKKDIIFKTKIGEITSINLDHDYKIGDDLINGTIYLNGSYKMTEASVLEEDFEYNIPFSIALSKRIKESTIKIEIDEFNYVINKDVLNVNIELLLTCEELIEETKEEDFLDEYFNETPPIIEVENEEKEEEKILPNITNIITTEDKYYTYVVHIVKEEETIETLSLKYNVSLDIIKEYNEIIDIKQGDKILIPLLND